MNNLVMKSKILMSISIVSLSGFIVAIFLLAIASTGLSGVLASGVELDANTIVSAASGRLEISESAISYLNTVRFYAWFPGEFRMYVPYFISILFLLSLFYRKINIFSVSTILFLIFPAIILSMPYPKKEAILFLFYAFVMAFAVRFQSVNCRNYLLLFIVIFGYIWYSYYFRSYFILILLAFIALNSISYMNIRLMLIVFLVALGVFLLIPIEVLQALQAPRDYVNEMRMLRQSDSSRSAFLNLVETGSHVEFIINYLYSAFRLNFPIGFRLGIRELYLTLYVIPLLVASIYFYIKYSPITTGRILSSLIISHLLVLNLFEPDLGSYLRHISNVAFFISVPMFDNLKVKI